MSNRNKFDVKSWLLASVYILLLVVVMPFAIWKVCNDEKNIEQRGKKLKAKIINIKGLKKNKFEIEYTIENNKFVSKITILSNHNKNIGDDIFIIYDTLDFENIKYFDE